MNKKQPYELVQARKERLQKAGLCPICGKRPIKESRTKCEQCLQRAAEAANERRQECGASGLCEMCGKAPPTPGRSKCQACIRRWNDNRNGRRAELRTKGICTEEPCGHPAMPGHTRCEKHFADNKAKGIALKNRRLAEGLCRRCGKETHTEHTQQCEVCHLRYLSFDLWQTRKRWPDLLALFVKQRGKCVYTGKQLTIGLDASIDHRIAKAKGGTNDIENLQWVDLCVNRMKLDQDEARFFKVSKMIAARASIPRSVTDLTCEVDLTSSTSAIMGMAS